jgi:hypothetical protein
MLTITQKGTFLAFFFSAKNERIGICRAGADQRVRERNLVGGIFGGQFGGGQLGQVRSGLVRSGQVRSGRAWSGQVGPGQVRSGQVMSAPFRLAYHSGYLLQR